MSDINVKISKQSRMVDLSKSVIGNDNENLQGKLIITFDEFVEGIARLEYRINDDKYYSMLERQDESYVLPITNIFTKEGYIYMQVVIDEGEEENGIPVFKSNEFRLYCGASINAQIEQPEELPTWIEQADSKLNEVADAIQECQNLNLDANRVENGVKVIITKKDGEQKEVIVADGERGKDGPQGPQGEAGPSYDDTEIRALLNLKVPKTTKINNKELSEDIELTPSDIGIGNVFKLKGSVATIDDLPSTGNQIGDVYYVEAEEVGYIWLEKQGVLQWEQLGLPIDLSNYVQKTDKATTTDLGLVKPDGTTIDIDGNGVITSMRIDEIGNISSSNPFIFEGKKRGIYFRNINEWEGALNFYSKASNSYSTTIMGDIGTMAIIILQEYSDNLSDNTFIAYSIVINQNGRITYSKILKSSTSTSGLKFIGVPISRPQFMGVIGNQTISGVKTFSFTPKCSNTPSANNDLANKKYVDDAISEVVLEPIIINVTSNTTINGYQVPELTTENIQEIYNGIVAGKEVVVSDATGNMHFKVNQADTDTDDIFVSFVYYDIMLLQYDTLGNITFKEIASKAYVDNAIGNALQGSY